MFLLQTGQMPSAAPMLPALNCPPRRVILVTNKNYRNKSKRAKFSLPVNSSVCLIIRYSLPSKEKRFELMWGP